MRDASLVSHLIFRMMRVSMAKTKEHRSLVGFFRECEGAPDPAVNQAAPAVRLPASPSSVFLPPDLRLPLNFSIQGAGQLLHAGASVRAEITVPELTEEEEDDDDGQASSEWEVIDACNLTDVAELLQCQAHVDFQSLGLPHGVRIAVRLALMDASGSVLAEDRVALLVRGVVAPSKRLPPCWEAGRPVHMQDPDCVWLWGALDPSQKVLLSLQEVGRPRRARTGSSAAAGAPAARIQRGSWGRLIPQLDALAQDLLASLLPPVGHVLVAHGSCALVGNAWYTP